MSSNIITKILLIDNMSCVNCENIIERVLTNVPGITSVTASYSKGLATLTYDEAIINLERIVEILAAENYKVKTDNSGILTGGKESDTNEDMVIKKSSRWKRTNSNQKDTKTIYDNGSKNTRDYSDLIGVIIIIIALYLIANHFGLSNIINRFPIAKNGMGYGMLFLIGLLTSVHCIAMCGGVCLSQCVPKKEDSLLSRFAAIRPSLLYNMGRVISYTLIGGVVGAIGSVISFSGMAKGIVQILAGVFMVIMGLNMLNIFPWLRKFNPRMPKIFAKKIYAQRKSNSPLYIGLLNGLMPCGPLQAMQLYALSTGSPLKGAVSMFIFSIGTVPLMFAFGALSSFLSKKFTGKMMMVSAVLVVFLGVFMFNNGMGLSGIVLPIIPAYADTSKESSNVAVLQEDVQVVTSGITSGSYEPIIVQKNIPVKWTIQVKEGQINGCNGTIIVPKYNIEKQLVVGDNIIEFTPTESGTIPFSCWMGMIRSKISVIDDLSKVDASVITDANTGNKSSTGGSCCAGGAGANSTSSTTNSSNTSGSNASGLTDNNLLDIKIPTDQVAVAKINSDGTQSVEITYDGKAFTPAVVVVQSGLETVWNIKSSGIDSTNNNLLFPNYNAKLIVQNGNYPIKFKPEQDFDFLTADGTQYGYVKVVTDIKDIDIAAIKKEVADYTPPTAAGQTGASGASCCN